jgi:UDP-2,3-diacylglucosamine pyrophosphatase LpxH
VASCGVVRTLVISDLHLGTRLGHDVLRQPVALERLLDALDGVDRLVLLGDVLELVVKADAAVEVAEPVLRAVGARLGREREVIIVPGNHDREFVRAWLRRLPADVGLGVDSIVPLDATAILARVASWLAPARVRAHYPGVWLSERVWATHGHYLDRHLLPESGAGVARGLLGRLPRDGATPIDYERAGGPSWTGLEAILTGWLPWPLATLMDDLVEVVRAATMPAIPRRLLSHRFARVNSMLLGAQMRRASMPALARVVHRLGVDADWVIFGHVHRLGPSPADDPRQWQGPGGRPRVVNAGSWLYEPRLVHRAKPPHPYWPGGAVVLDDDQDPRAIGLLDDVEASLLH